MPKDFHKLSSLDRLRARACRIRKRPCVKMRPCQSCLRDGTQCAIDRDISEKCAECLRRQRFCDLASNNDVLEREIAKRNKIEEDLVETQAKVVRLRKLLKLREQRIRELGLSEKKNIEEIVLEERERGEAPSADASASGGFLSDAEVNRLIADLPPGFDCPIMPPS